MNNTTSNASSPSSISTLSSSFSQSGTPQTPAPSSKQLYDNNSINSNMNRFMQQPNQMYNQYNPIPPFNHMYNGFNQYNNQIPPFNHMFNGFNQYNNPIPPFNHMYNQFNPMLQSNTPFFKWNCVPNQMGKEMNNFDIINTIISKSFQPKEATLYYVLVNTFKQSVNLLNTNLLENIIADKEFDQWFRDLCKESRIQYQVRYRIAFNAILKEALEIISKASLTNSKSPTVDNTNLKSKSPTVDNTNLKSKASNSTDNKKSVSNKGVVKVASTKLNKIYFDAVKRYIFVIYSSGI